MSKGGKVFTAVGLLLLAAALCLTGYNLWTDASAGSSAKNAARELQSAISRTAALEQTGEDTVPDYLLAPEVDMPETELDGEQYIGVLELPTLSLTLPVQSQWSYPALKVSPCRYAGSAYQGDLVVAGHNYRSHFGRLANLSPGDPVTFTDMEGSTFSYTVMELETLPADAVEEMTSGDWDLTLFTCTLDGQSRITVRCVGTDAGLS